MRNDLETATGADLVGRRIEQLSVFVGDRLGALLGLLQLLAPDRIRVCAVTMSEATDHAVIRLVVDRPSAAQALLEEHGYPVLRHRMLGVALPQPEESKLGLRDVLHALLSAEVKVNYVYALGVRVDERAVLAVNVEDPEMAERALVSAGLELVDQDQLGWGEDTAGA